MRLFFFPTVSSFHYCWARRQSVDGPACVCSAEQVGANQLQHARKYLTQAIRHTEAVLESMRAEHHPLAAYIFVPRRHYRNMPDTKSGSRREVAVRLRWQAACELGFRGLLANGNDCWSEAKRQKASGPDLSWLRTPGLRTTAPLTYQWEGDPLGLQAPRIDTCSGTHRSTFPCLVSFCSSRPDKDLSRALLALLRMALADPRPRSPKTKTRQPAELEESALP
jgi:hypothetical protein